MKIIKLELRGFGPFRREQTIDFTTFAEEGLFLIGGKTGAGKSSVLDAISFALYARTPRYEGTPRGVRSNFAETSEETSVRLEFEHGDEHYRITRSPEYVVPKRRGEGTTSRAAKQELEQWVDGGWRTHAKSVREVAEKLSEIFPLSATEFLQVVMLAQNQFQQFLHAESRERQELLRKLFHTGRYKVLADLLAERAKASGAQLNSLNSTLESHASTLERKLGELLSPNPEAPAALLQEPVPAVKESEPAREITTAWLETFTEVADQEHTNREKMHTRRREARERAAEFLRDALQLRSLQVRRAKAMADRASLLADHERMQLEVVARLESDATAAPLVPIVHASAEAATALAAAEQLRDRAHEQLAQELEIEQSHDRWSLFDNPAPAVSQVREVARSLTEQIGTLRDNEQIDTTIAAKRREVEELQATAERLQGELESIQARVEARPTERAELVAALSVAREKARGVDDAQETVARAARQLQAAQNLPIAEAAVRKAAQDLDDALAQAAKAEDHERDLNSRRWLGAATYLAETLIAGEPCQVCGATEHPAPAQSEVSAVSDADLRAAEQATASARSRSDKARSHRDTCLSGAERIRAVAEDLDLAAATERHEAAQRSLEQILLAETDIARLTDTLESLDRAANADGALHTKLTAARDESREALTTLKSQLSELTNRAGELRGEYATVGERLKRTRAIESACQAVVTAAEACDRASSAATNAGAQLEDALRASSFSNAEAVLAARLEDNARDKLAHERDTHAKNLHAAEQILAEPELSALPQEPIDVDTPTARNKESQDSLDAASHALGVAATLRDEIRSTVGTAKRALDELAVIGERAEAEKELSSVLSGQNERKQNLEAFVLAAYLEEVLAAANARLSEITSNRYELELDDDLAGRGRQSGLDLKIFDVYNGKSRQPKSLSGGETFLVSLALALGLADVVSSQAGGIALDTLFIDEGFGSLDSDTLEVAMRTLDQLREGGRTIGVISHVGSMQERIPAHLNVFVSGDGSSEISTDVLPLTR